MTRRTKERKRGEEGFVLVAVLGLMVLMLGVAAALHSGVIAEAQLRASHVRAMSGFYAAESGINHGMADYKNIFASYRVPSGSDFTPHSFTLNGRNVVYEMTAIPGFPKQFPLPAGTQFAGLDSIQYQYAVTSTSSTTAGDTEATIGSQFQVDNIPLFQFLAFYVSDLEILPGPTMNLTGPVHTNGTLYLNSDTACSGSPCTGGLAIADSPPAMPTVSVTASGNIFRGRKDRSACTGTVQVSKLVDANHNGLLDPVQVPCSGVLSSAQLSGWLGAMKAHQPVVQVPQPGLLDRVTGEYWQKATLRIALDLTAADATGLYRIVVQDIDGNTDGALTARLQTFMQANPGRIFYNDVPTATHTQSNCSSPNAGDFCHRASYVGSGAAAFGSNAEVYACPQASLVNYGCTTYVANRTLSDGTLTARRGGFYNNREEAWVYMLNVNVHDLLAWNRAQASGSRLFDPDEATYGGVVLYLTVVGPYSTGTLRNGIRYGVRVFGSSDLDFPSGVPDPTGLTVISDQAVYVEGSYNVGTVLKPKQPAAFMADTVNVLSNGWSGPPDSAWTSAGGAPGCRNDCQSYQPLANRPGANTTIYAAFLAGVESTTPGNYNGGFENYPRFHENWNVGGQQMLTYRGSFVSLGPPSRANGSWCGTGTGCNIYNPPRRNWNYDTDFQVVENLPPLTPRVVAVQQILFTENFR
ncbi:MAG TPA: hypothetical protein VFD84_06935 [Candidatus Binatia bacterium]|nr:hypothetical protein [Candidatus Binatia bacterium]